MNIQALKAEIDTDPLTRGYSGMTDEQVATSLNTPDRNLAASSTALLDYLMTQRFRTDNVYGRIKIIAELQPVLNIAGTAWQYPDLPFGASDAMIPIDTRVVAAAKTMVKLAELDFSISQTLLDADLAHVLTQLALGTDKGHCFDGTIKSGIEALSQNQQSRGQELGLGRVRVGHVGMARAA